MRRAHYLFGSLLLLVATACEPEGLPGPEDYVERMRRERPTGLPAIDDDGAQVFGPTSSRIRA